jgi:hypothetical protein
MSSNNKNTIKSKVRAVIQRNKKNIVSALDELRSSNTVNFHPIVQSFRQIAIRDTPKLFCLGTREFENLLWNYRPLKPISLKGELAWAGAWLTGQSNKINFYRNFSSELQETILSGEIETAINNLEEFCLKNGWSLWAVELRLALEQSVHGTEKQKILASKWIEKTKSGRVELIIKIISDRNDETLSFDAFSWGCYNSLSRFTTELSAYLIYRSLSYIENEESLAIILCQEMISNLTDYYEAVVETLFHIVSNSIDLKVFRLDAIQLIDTLLKDGYSDCRLQKLYIVLSGSIISIKNITTCNPPLFQLTSDVCLTRQNLKNSSQNISSFLKNILDDIYQCYEKGSQAQEVITRLIKFGTNFKSLDIGVCIGISPQLLAKDWTSDVILPFPMIWSVCGWEFDDITALDDDSINTFLNSLPEDNSLVMKRNAKDFLNILQGQSIETIEVNNSLRFLWLGHQLIKQQRWNEAIWLCDYLSQIDYFWYRQSEKLRLCIFTSKCDLVNALELIIKWLLKGIEYASEFPIAKIFFNRKWLSFSNIEPILVGYVSYHAFLTTENQDFHHICKQACRIIAINGGMAYFKEKFENSDKDEQIKLIAFIRDVWNEVNFDYIETIQTTEDARNEEMQVMQLLMDWDEANISEYIESIKELTLDQTLRKGLKEINQTRVFINELALYRWAEKELYQDYERWIKLSESQSNTVLADNLTREYVIDPNNLELLKTAFDKEPTEADTLLIKLVERLFDRFLHDPNEGLDCYLSLRIRHGSLQGILLGTLEQRKLLYLSTDFSRIEFNKYWGSKLGIDIHDPDFDLLIKSFEIFSSELLKIKDEIIKERIQINSDKKNKGMIPDKIDSTTIRAIAFDLSNNPMSFQLFINTTFFTFWIFLENYLVRIGEYIRQEAKKLIQSQFEILLTELRNIGLPTQSLETELRSVATITQSSCDTIADWFKPPRISGKDQYLFSDAIEIAKEATRNVYRTFPVNINLCNMPDEELYLASSGLSVVTDCLFIIFENIWKHSGLKEKIGLIDLDANFDHKNKLLTLKIFNNLSDNEIYCLKANKLDLLKTKYQSQDHTELTRCEGGSGFAKLSRFTRFVNRDLVTQPLDFGICENQWMIQICIPLYKRGGLYEAYG